MATLQPDRRLIMFVDMESYSRHDDAGQINAQMNFRPLMRRAAEQCGLDRDGWEIQSSGDGELALFPLGTPEPRLVADLVPAIDRILRDHNRDAGAHAQVRMRVAFHQGLVTRTENGYAGSAVVTAARLVEAPALKEALASFPEAAVAMIVSSTIYQDVVSQSYSGIRKERYGRVSVRVKSFGDEAWIFIPDENVNSAPIASVDASTPAPRPDLGGTERAGAEPTSGSRFAFGSVVNHGPSVFGDHGRAWGTGDAQAHRQGRQ
ncbi:nucleotidyl cyclase domain-containing protein [Micromonospora sp. SD19]